MIALGVRSLIEKNEVSLFANRRPAFEHKNQLNSSTANTENKN